MKKIISKVMAAIMVAVAIWFAWSVVDINVNNNPSDDNYGNFSKCNAIIMVSELFN